MSLSAVKKNWNSHMYSALILPNLGNAALHVGFWKTNEYVIWLLTLIHFASAYCWEHALWWSNSYQVINLCSWCFQRMISRIASTNFMNMKIHVHEIQHTPSHKNSENFLIYSETLYVKPLIKDYGMCGLFHLIILSENIHALELIRYFSLKLLNDLVGFDLLKTM